MNTTIPVKEDTKKEFLEKKRKYCLRVNRDATADEYEKFLLGLDNGNHK